MKILYSCVQNDGFPVILFTNAKINLATVFPSKSQQQPIHPNSSSLHQLRLLTYYRSPCCSSSSLYFPKTQNSQTSQLFTTRVSSEKRSEKCMTPENSFSSSAAAASSSSSSSSSDCVFCIKNQKLSTTYISSPVSEDLQNGYEKKKAWVERRRDCT